MRTKVFSILALSMFLLVSCDWGGDKNGKDSLPEMELSREDTTEIYSMANDYVELIKKNDFSAAVDMLYVVDTLGQINPLSSEVKETMAKRFSAFGCYDCKLTGFIIRDSLDNEMEYTVQILKDGSIADNYGVMKFALNPVLRDGKWYLTLLDSYATGVKSH